MIDSYETESGREAMLRFGPAAGPVVVMALPLFEEANRTRAFAVTLCRALSNFGLASALPDLPGQGESLVPTEQTNLGLLRSSFAAVVEHLHRERYHVYSASIRSGAILDVQALSLGRWSLTPVSGPDLLRDQARIMQAPGREGAARQLRSPFQADDDGMAIEIAGNKIGLLLLQGLETDNRPDLVPVQRRIPTRVVRLESDRGEAHRHVPGPSLWRRAEPANDPALAAVLAQDIADWIATCEG